MKRWRVPLACAGALAVVLGSLGTRVKAVPVAAVMLSDASAVWGSEQNPCARKVETRLAILLGGGARVLERAWRLEWQRPLPPMQLSAHDVLSTGALITTSHVQGFTPTYSHAHPYALSHSDDQHGAVVLVGRSRSALAAAAIWGLGTRHPSGVHAIGQYVAVADDADLVLLDVDHPEAAPIRHPMPFPGLQRAGGGLGLARLLDGRHLVVASRPGNFRPGPRVTRFFALTGGLTAPSSLELLGEHVYREPAAWRGDHRYSENLSVITECGTGQLYTLHTTGDTRLRGSAYARVSRIELEDGQPALHPLAFYTLRQRAARCHARSALTAFVTQQHELELACHERAVHPGLGFRGSEAVRFQLMR